MYINKMTDREVAEFENTLKLEEEAYYNAVKKHFASNKTYEPKEENEPEDKKEEKKE